MLPVQPARVKPRAQPAYLFTALSTRHLFVVVAQSDHLINLRQPAYVIAAIAHTIGAVWAAVPTM
jgi:hypothetical protein